jgi:cytochrome c oxidase subunit I
MRSTTDSTAVAVDRRPNLISSLFQSVVSGIVLGVVGAVIAGLLVNRVTTAYSPDGVPNDDAVAASVFIAWALFFSIGIGAFNGIFEWAFGRHEPTPAEELQLAGKGQGLWRYFRFTTDHKVVGLQYLATALALSFSSARWVRSRSGWSNQDPGRSSSTHPRTTPLWACTASS